LNIFAAAAIDVFLGLTALETMRKVGEYQVLVSLSQKAEQKGAEI